jgi:hypothetical protein
MAETLFQFQTPVMGPDGTWYEARACGSEMPGGTWQGWIEFVPRGSAREHVRTPRETTQPNRTDTIYWATGLSSIYLEGALQRALAMPRSATPSLPPQPAIFARPAPAAVPATSTGVSVLDPFSAYENGEALLRKQLGALSAWHLVNIIRDYDLTDDDRAVLNRLPAAELVELIVAGVESRVGAHPLESPRR